MNIWIINPFDELPGDTDVRLRYWSICDTLASMGHDVTWWSSDFSHRHKRYRKDIYGRDEGDKGDLSIEENYRSISTSLNPNQQNLSHSSPSSLPLNFSIRLVPTCPYKRNVSLARLRNHRHFRWHFQNMAMEEIESGKISAPDRMVVSLPPLGSADAAFAIRERFGGEVILDYMDAWPETFYRVLPGWVPQKVKAFFFRPFLKTAERACRGADRISAVAQVYVDLAKARASDKPMHLCYHGIDLAGGYSRDEGDKGDLINYDKHSPSSLNNPIKTDLSNSSPSSLPLKIAYIGALERSYDLKTAIRAVHELNTQGHESCPTKPGEARVELHIAGAGTCEESLKAFAQSLSSPGRPAGATQPGATCEDPKKKIPPLSPLSPSSLPLVTTFHGNLNRDDLRAFLASCHLGLIPMRQDSYVGMPYKVADYCAAGLPVISSLDGECRQLLDTKNAGSFYEPGNTRQLMECIKSYLEDNAKLVDQAGNAKGIATGLFDRKRSYQELAAFIENS